MSGAGPRPGLRTTAGLAVLAVVAWLPALASSPGRMPADTKLFLYLDPGGLLARAPSTWEPDQFAGWVPHQQITYLWPQGPWYALFDLLGVPDWIAHRLWIGAILFAAGAGTWWLARQLGFGRGAALAGALVYQCAPYVLPYVSRTSLLLLPWAGLGWIIALTVRATRRSRIPLEPAAGLRRRLDPWLEPALIGLVVATVGSGNAAALALVAPGPLAWLVHDGRLRSGLAIAARTALCCLAASLWWIAMLLVQSRHGAPVLAFSETLRDVSSTATGPEVTRGLGYWLFYVRDLAGPTTSASLDYLQSTRGLALSFLVPTLGLAGIGLTRWRDRRFAALLVVAGAVVAVGVHPIDDPAPWIDALVTDDEGGLALALRSSTRAVPVLLVGVALGVSAAVGALASERRRLAALGAVALLAVANAPFLLRADLVDPNNDRDADPPAAWSDAAELLDDPASRVLQLPGAEFGSFRWGHTVDQPLVALADQPLVTRDLLPLGSGPAMDLLYALDDRIQLGVAEPEMIAPIARLFGADTIWLANDLAFDRYRTARPEVVRDLVVSAVGVAAVVDVGDPDVNRPRISSVDPESVASTVVGTPVPPVSLASIEGPLGIERIKESVVVLSGAGDGVVDAAAAGLVDGRELIRYSGSIDDDAIDDVALVVVTDSNRDRARYWRSSQDVTGHTEPGGPDDDLLDPTAADQRLTVLDPPGSVREETQTIAVQDGPLTAIASSYGEPFAATPEDRAVHAVDGDSRTAWTVGEHGDPVGERIRFTLADDLTGTGRGLRLRQPVPGPTDRTIARVEVTVESGGTVGTTIAGLDARSWETAGQSIDVPLHGPGDEVTIEILEVTSGAPGTAGAVGAVGFVDVGFDESLGLAPTVEWIRPPVDLDGRVPDTTPVAFVLTRERTDPTDRWRDDPEPELRRLLAVDVGERTLDGTVTLRLGTDADDTTIAETLGLDGAFADARLDGVADLGGWSALDGDASTTWFTPFDDVVGSTLTVPVESVDPGPLVVTAPDTDLSPITELTLTGTDGAAVVELTADGNGQADATRRVGRLDRALRGPVTVTVSAVEERTTVDRRFGDTTLLPAAITELELPGATPPPLDRTAPVGRECDDRLLTLDGAPIPLTWSSTVGDLLSGTAVTARTCGPVEVAPGSRVASTGRDVGLTVDRVVLTEPPPSIPPVTGTLDVLERAPRSRRALVDCPEGCWFVLGEGANDAWSLTVEGTALPDPELVDGGFNGWWIDPTDGPVTVEARWTAQGAVTVALVLSGLAIAALAAVAIFARRRTLPDPPPATISRACPVPRRRLIVAVPATGLAVGLLVGPIWALAGLVVMGLVAASTIAGERVERIPTIDPGRALAVVAVALAGVVGAAVVVVERAERPAPDLSWTAEFAAWHRPALFALVLLAAATILPDCRRPRAASHDLTDPRPPES